MQTLHPILHRAPLHVPYSPPGCCSYYFGFDCFLRVARKKFVNKKLLPQTTKGSALGKRNWEGAGAVSGWGEEWFFPHRFCLSLRQLFCVAALLLSGARCVYAICFATINYALLIRRVELINSFLSHFHFHSRTPSLFGFLFAIFMC